MSYPNVDQLFIDEMNNHNDIIAMTGELQAALTLVAKFGLGINTFIHDVLDFIQKKEYDNAAKLLTDTVYSIDQLVIELGVLSRTIKQGVNRVHEQEGKGFQKTC